MTRDPLGAVTDFVLARGKHVMSLLPDRGPFGRLAGALQCCFDEAVRNGAREPFVPALLPRRDEARMDDVLRSTREIRPTPGGVQWEIVNDLHLALW